MFLKIKIETWSQSIGKGLVPHDAELELANLRRYWLHQILAIVVVKYHLLDEFDIYVTIVVWNRPLVPINIQALAALS
jgi:hypothetical protein